MPTLLVRRRAAATQDARSLEIVRRLDSDLSDDRSLGELVALLREDPALEETRTLAQRTADDAVAILDQLPAGPVRDALQTFTRTLVERRS